MDTVNIDTWNAVYSEGRSLLEWPDEQVVSFLAKNKEEIQKGLDIGCGAGRHVFLMCKMGMEAVGIDSSPAAIKFACAKQERLQIKKAKFIKWMAQNTPLPFEDNTFDLVIAWGLFHYLTQQEQRSLLAEIRRILVVNGRLLCTLRSEEDGRVSKGTEVEPNRFLVDYFDETSQSPKQTLMYFWSRSAVYTFFDGFFNDISLGHRLLQPIGKLGSASAHWLIEAKNKGS